MIAETVSKVQRSQELVRNARKPDIRLKHFEDPNSLLRTAYTFLGGRDGISFLGELATQRSEYLKTAAGQAHAQRVCESFDTTIKRLYPGTTDSKAFLIDQLKKANQIRDYLWSTIAPNRRDTLSARSELALIPENPLIDLLVNVSASDIDDPIREQTQAHIVLARIASELNHRSEVHRFAEELGNIHRVFRERLYKGEKKGERTFQTTYSLHDNVANAPIWTSGVDDIKELAKLPYNNPRKTHWVIHEQDMGYVEDVGWVTTRIDKKSRGSEGVKVIKKGHLRRLGKLDGDKNNGKDILVPHPDADVPDSMRMLFIVKGTKDRFDPRVNTMMSKTIAIICDYAKEKYGEHAIEEIKPDHNTNGTPDQEKIHYQRYTIKVKGKPIPFEVEGYPEVGLLIDMLQTGRYNKKRRKYENGATGPAHILYEIRKAAIAAKYVLKGDLRRRNLSIEQLAQETLVDTAEMTKGRNRMKEPPAEIMQQLKGVNQPVWRRLARMVHVGNN